MPDYKDIIVGTIGNIVEKVKEVASNADVRGVVEQGTSRIAGIGKLAKLNLELNGDNEELKRVFTEIGRLYYEQAKDAPEGFFAALFAQANEISARMVAKTEEINKLKENASPQAEQPDIDVEITEVEVTDAEVSEFEDVVDKTESEGKDE